MRGGKTLPKEAGNMTKDKMSYWLTNTEEVRLSEVGSRREHYLKKTQLHRKSKRRE